jgi:TetR/AcrR family transcriptional regulator
VSKGTLYLYYDSKEELFKAVVRQTILPLIAQFRESIDRSDSSGSQLLQEFVWSWWTQFGNTRLSGIAKLCIGEAGNFPEVAQFWNEEVIASNNELLTIILSRGIDSGEFRAVDIESVVHLVMAPLVLKAIMQHSIEPCCAGGGNLDPERFIVHHLDMLLRGLATPAAHCPVVVRPAAP